MILPFNDTPKNSLYYIGALVLNNIKSNSMTLDEIFLEINKSEKVQYINVLYALDWLYLLGALKFKEDGKICLQND